MYYKSHFRFEDIEVQYSLSMWTIQINLLAGGASAQLYIL